MKEAKKLITGDYAISVKILKLLLAVSTTLLIIHLGMQYLNLEVYDEKHAYIFELTNRFDFDDESSVPTWFSHLLFLTVAATAGFIGCLEKMRSKKALWWMLSGVFLALAIDEIATLHEFILQVVHLSALGESNPSRYANAWVIVLPFILLGLFAFLRFAVKHLPMRIIWLMALSAGVFLIGAVGVDIVTSVSERELYFTQGILVALEEGLEVIGLSIFLYSLFVYLETEHQKTLVAVSQALRQKN